MKNAEMKKSALVRKHYSPKPGEKWFSSLPGVPLHSLSLQNSLRLLLAIPSSSALYNFFSNLNGLRKVSRKTLSPFFCPLTFEKAASKIETCLAKENGKVRKRKVVGNKKKKIPTPCLLPLWKSGTKKHVCENGFMFLLPVRTRI